MLGFFCAGYAEAASIQTQPAPQTVNRGAAVTFTVGTTGTQFQWQKDGVDIPGATAAAYSIPSVQPQHIGYYTCRVTDANGTVTSQQAALNIPGVPFNLWQGLVAYFPLDGNSTDASPFCRDGVPVRLSYGPDRNGVAGRSAVFSNIPRDQGSFIEVPGLINQPYWPVTYSFWARFRSLGSSVLIGRKQTWNQEDGALVIYDNPTDPDPAGRAARSKLSYYTGGANLLTDFTPPVDVWVKIDMTYGPDSVASFYINGNLIRSATYTASQQLGFPFRIGGATPLDGVDGNNTNSLDGFLDDVRIYNRALSSSEVAGLYASEVAGPLVLSNVRAAQRAGSRLVDIDYDLVGGSGAVGIELQVSLDGGTTWGVASATGAVGAAVNPGTNLRMTWNADQNPLVQPGSQIRFRVVVNQEPTGMVRVAAGQLPASSPLGAVPVGDFYIGKYEVQWGEFQTVRAWAVSNGYDIGGTGAGTGDAYPVHSLTWYSALKWCNARSEMEGLAPVYRVNGAVYRTGNIVPDPDPAANGYRVPLEKEWEWAARGGQLSQGFTYSGGNGLSDVGWYVSNSGYTTNPVGGKAPNELGIYDMTGNVWELCADVVADGARVMRGGSLGDDPGNCLLDFRGARFPLDSLFSIGFRVVRSVGSQSPVISLLPVVSNVTFSQRTDGSKLVDIRYDLFGGTSSVAVGVSYDGGATYNALQSVTGAVGTGVVPGTGKQIVWNAGTDYLNSASSNVKVRVTALLDGAGGTFSHIPAGTYQMGRLVADSDITDAPVTSVTLSGYYVSVDPTTKARWDAVRVWGLSNGYTDLATGAGKASNHPVQTVTWHDVVKWANAASEKDGLMPCYRVGGAVYRSGQSDSVTCDWSVDGYRLPTEAEWEVAARGGLTGKRFPWGDTITQSQANYLSDAYFFYDLGPTRGYHPTYATGSMPYTSPIGSFAANGYGLKDMAGNVFQWCWDWYGTYSGGTDPKGAASGLSRVLRGGGWGNDGGGGAGYARCAQRYNGSPGVTNNGIGFRLARGSSSGSGHRMESSTGVVDTTGPVLTVPSNVTAQATSAAGATVTYPAATASDIVTASPVLSYIHATGSVFPIGVTTVTVTATDSVGNTSTGTFTVTVADTASLVYSSASYPCFKGPGEMVVPVTVRRSLVDPQNAVSVVVTPSSDTLQSGDYSLPASPMVLNWAAGDTSDKTFPVIFRAGRTIAEGGESLRLTLQNPVGAYLGEIGTATIALTPRNPGFLSFGSATLERVKPESGDLTVQIPVRRAQGGTGAVAAEVVVSGGTARPGDFTVANPVRLEWADGDTADKTFEVVFKEAATVPAAGKTIQFRLQNLSGGALAGGTTSATLVVRGATLPGALNFSAASYAAVKAATGNTLVPITVNRELGGNGAVSVQVTPMGGTASGLLDFSLPASPVTLNWADDEMGPKTFNVLLKETAEIASGGETLLLKLEAVTGGAQVGRVSACTVTFTASDTAAPVLVLESPANRATVTGESVLFKGTATDASGVTRVEVTLNTEDPQEAVLMPSPNGNTFGWMTTLVPEQGVNTVKVQAFDGRGNASAMLTRQFTFLYARPALAGTFDGRLEPATDAASLEEPGQFVQTRGEGLLTATVSATGSFTGRLTTGGTAVSFKGVLRRDGVAWFDSKSDSLEVAKGRGASRVVLGSLSLRAQETGELPRLVGELVSETATFGTVSAEKFVYSAARVLPAGMQRVPVSILDPASENGRYTALLEPRVDEGVETNNGLERTQFPQSSGYAKLTVASSGVVSLVGRLADGTAVSYSNRLSPGGAVPVYVPLYSGRGFLAGTPVFDDSQPETDLAGARMRWVRPAGLPAPFEAGWEDGIAVDLVGSKYVPVTKPTRTVPVPANPYTVFGSELPVTALTVDTVPDFVGLRVGIAGGGLTAGTTDEGQLSPTNVFKVTGTPGAAGLKLLFSTADGGFTGSFTHPVTNRAQPVAGVVLQKARKAGGGFVFLPPRGSTVPAAVGSVEVTVPQVTVP